MKRLLPIVLFISVGLSQQIIHTETYENGNIKSITSHKETRNRIEKVKEVEYYEKGQKESEIHYKDGKVDGLWTIWWENRQKKEERTYKDGKPDGLYTNWDENGQKEEGVHEGMEKLYIEWNFFNEDGIY